MKTITKTEELRDRFFNLSKDLENRFNEVAEFRHNFISEILVEQDIAFGTEDSLTKLMAIYLDNGYELCDLPIIEHVNGLLEVSDHFLVYADSETITLVNGHNQLINIEFFELINLDAKLSVVSVMTRANNVFL